MHASGRRSLVMCCLYHPYLSYGVERTRRAARGAARVSHAAARRARARVCVCVCVLAVAGRASRARAARAVRRAPSGASSVQRPEL